MANEISEMKKVGIGLIGFSILFSFLGVLLFFDRGLLDLGNIFLLSGVALLLGWKSMWQLFAKKANYKVYKGPLTAIRLHKLVEQWRTK